MDRIPPTEPTLVILQRIRGMLHGPTTRRGSSIVPVSIGDVAPGPERRGTPGGNPRRAVVRKPPPRYARGVTSDAQTPESAPAHPIERLSALAAASFLMAVLSVSGCIGISWLAYSAPDRFVFLAAVPALALGAIVCGALARRNIARSGGVLRGRGLAAFGMLVGLMGGVIPAAFLLSALLTLSSLKSLAPAVERVVLAASVQRPQSARVDLAPDAIAQVTDARLIEIGRRITLAAGAPSRADVSLAAVAESRKLVAEMASSARAGGSDPAAALGELSPKPVVIRCANANVFVFAILDEDALNQSRVLLKDALFVLPDRSGVTLRPAGPARDVARALGVGVVEIGDG